MRKLGILLSTEKKYVGGEGVYIYTYLFFITFREYDT